MTDMLLLPVPKWHSKGVKGFQRGEKGNPRASWEQRDEDTPGLSKLFVWSNSTPGSFRDVLPGRWEGAAMRTRRQLTFLEPWLLPGPLGTSHVLPYLVPQ